MHKNYINKFLLEFINDCNPKLTSSNFKTQHTWLENQTTNKNNILIVRKFAGKSNRGEVFIQTNKPYQYMPADNEPLICLYNTWLDNGNYNNSDLRNLLEKREIYASWYCDLTKCPNNFRYGGKYTPFRDEGLKLCHIYDAGQDITLPPNCTDEILVRYFRSLSPLNLFLFPSIRKYTFTLLKNPTNWLPQHKDWGEDIELQKALWSYLKNFDQSTYDAQKLNFSNNDLSKSNWKEFLENTIVTIELKNKNTASSNNNKNPIVSPKLHLQASPASSNSGVAKKNNREEAKPFWEALEELREWRIKYPNTERFDGTTGSKSNPRSYYFIKFDGYEKLPPFNLKGTLIPGSEYNGIHAFHGDSKTEPIDRLIAIADQVEECQDVLIPSATRKGNPKFALKGFEDSVSGFYLYKK
jgi:hypothetical protein